MQHVSDTQIVPQPVKDVIIRRCAWCGHIIGARMAPGMSGETSGICRHCYHDMMRDIQVRTKEKGD